MDLRLTDKRALIIGSSSGIGAEIARMLALEGAKVVIHGRNKDRAQAVVSEIRSTGGQASFALGDLTRADDAAAIAKTAEQAFGGIDILV